MSEIKLIVVDMDETFLRQDKTYHVDKFKELLQALRERDILFSIASGNSYHKLRAYFDAEDRQGMYFSGDNGTYLVKDDELLETQPILPATVASIVDFLDEFEGYHLTLSAGNCTYIRESEGPAYELACQYNVNLEVVDDFEDVIKQHPIVKMGIISDHSLDQNKVVTRILNERYSDIHSVTSGGGWIDVITKEGGKGYGVRYLQEKYNITPQETMTFGDSLNDLSMMHEAHYQMAMGNSDSELADQCRFVIGSNQDQAVLALIEELLEASDLSFLENYRRYPSRGE